MGPPVAIEFLMRFPPICRKCFPIPGNWRMGLQIGMALRMPFHNLSEYNSLG